MRGDRAYTHFDTLTNATSINPQHNLARLCILSLKQARRVYFRGGVFVRHCSEFLVKYRATGTLPVLKYLSTGKVTPNLNACLNLKAFTGATAEILGQPTESGTAEVIGPLSHCIAVNCSSDVHVVRPNRAQVARARGVGSRSLTVSLSGPSNLSREF